MKLAKALFSNEFLSKGGERHTCTIGIFEKDAFLHHRPRNERPDRVEFREFIAEVRRGEKERVSAGF